MGTSTVFVVNTDGTNAHPIDATRGGSTAVWSPDGTRLAVEMTALRVIVVSAAEAGVTELPALGATPAWSPDSRQIVLINSFTDHIYVVNSDGTPTGVRLLYSDATDVDHPSWSPDGSRIAFEGVFDPLPPRGHL
jgi:Tol biopolymer transport system component